jgi:hypothetical protein
MSHRSHHYIWFAISEMELNLTFEGLDRMCRQTASSVIDKVDHP